jgi:hypothetical protein
VYVLNHHKTLVVEKVAISGRFPVVVISLCLLLDDDESQQG